MVLLLSIISNLVILLCFFAMYSVIFADELPGNVLVRQKQFTEVHC